MCVFFVPVFLFQGFLSNPSVNLLKTGELGTVFTALPEMTSKVSSLTTLPLCYGMNAANIGIRVRDRAKPRESIYTR